MPETPPSIRVVALYHFTPFRDVEAMRAPLQAVCDHQGLKGIVLLAPEGINGTIAGSHDGIACLLDYIRNLPGCDVLEIKESSAMEMPFRRMKVRVKKEIVTMGQPDIDPRKDVGQYVAPEDWNALISDPGTIVIDTRNDYEVAIGTFQGAENPKTRSFREFPEWFRNRRKALEAEGRVPKIAMFCTGGIRCEKSTSFLKAEGLEDVYHLQGGILKYLENIPEEKSLWEGECFVFDQRISVKHGLEIGSYDICHACRRPIDEHDKTSPLYLQGVSCPHCHDERNDAQRDRYAARERQEMLARKRGKPHLGS